VSARLYSLVDRVEQAHAEAESVAALARSVRDALREHIGDQEFVLDCLERMLNAPGFIDMRRRWTNPPLHADMLLNYKFQVFFWVPGYVNAPHQHNTWSVTGVMHDQCSVFVYRRADTEAGAEPEFIIDRRLVAEAGEVGYLLPGCTHSVGNPGRSISCTFHVFSDSQDERDRPRDTIWYPKPGAKGPAMDPRYKAMFACAGMLGKIRHERSARLLDRIFALGGPRVRLACVRAMMRIDPEKAVSRGEEFYSALPAASHEALAEILTGARSPASVH
jgi:predicted metal-dependent enzyme (double-stranded beta helix superfamily)